MGVASVKALAKLSVNGVRKSFAAKGRKVVTALEDTTFSCREGEFVTIVGPSGCGKSTLLRIVAGLEEPSAGSVFVDGKEVRGPGADRGMVFQSYTLFPWLKVIDNIAFGLKLKGVGAEERRRVALQYLEKIGLSEFADAYPAELSGGMKQRVAIARALANDPEVLLMDEPFGALDAQTRLIMQELLLSVWEGAEKTVLFVTHDVEEAIFMADRVLVMSARPGRVKEDIEVPLPRPRSYEVKTEPAFLELRRHLTALLREEASLAALGGAAAAGKKAALAMPSSR